MSIQNLLSPNFYDLNCENLIVTDSLTVDTINVDNVTVNDLTVNGLFTADALTFSGDDNLTMNYFSYDGDPAFQFTGPDGGPPQSINTKFLSFGYRNYVTPSDSRYLCQIIFTDEIAFSGAAGAFDNSVPITSQALPVELRPSVSQTFMHTYACAGATSTNAQEVGELVIKTTGVIELYPARTSSAAFGVWGKEASTTGITVYSANFCYVVG
jgi:hypothetical protein